MSLVRSAGLQKFRECVARLGGDTETYARRVGLPIEALDTDEVLIEDWMLATVLEAAATDLRCPDLGLRVGELQEFSMLGPLSVAIQHSSSVREALDCTSRYMFVHARDMSVVVVEDAGRVEGTVALQYSYGPGVRALPQATDMTLMFMHRAARFLVGADYGLRTVELPHSAAAGRKRYEQAFGVPVRFRRPGALLRIASSFLNRPLRGVDETLRALAMGHLARQTPPGGPVVTGQVRAVLEQSLGTGSVDLADVAHVLAVHPRTLQRHLASEGTSYASVLDGVRRARARFYLTTTDMPMAQVGSLVGLSEQAVLTRCARRWWGRTPSQLRRDAQRPERPC